MKKALILTAIVGLLLASVMTLGCGKEKEGQLPTIGQGDKWVYELLSGGAYYTLTFEVTGEGVTNNKDCWVVEMSFSPSYSGIETATGRIDKSNHDALQWQMSGELMGTSYTVAQNITSQSLEGTFWPLTVGKETKEVQNTTTTTTWGGETQTETETKTLTYKVERMEEITVSAGMFKCFVIVEYNESGDKILTKWYSDKVKRYVKQTDHELSETMELKSYSV